jgi:hypothetical protein
MKAILRYFNRIFITLSILLNVLTGGKSNQTFSARNYEWKVQNKPNLVWLIDFIFEYFFNDPGHCLLAYAFWLTIKKCY